MTAQLNHVSQYRVHHIAPLSHTPGSGDYTARIRRLHSPGPETIQPGTGDHSPLQDRLTGRHHHQQATVGFFFDDVIPAETRVLTEPAASRRGSAAYGGHWANELHHIHVQAFCSRGAVSIYTWASQS
ncbi:unnamed protein product [Merluccius merluccius]